MYWICENYVTDVLILRKLCNRCTESAKLLQQTYWLWENYVRDVLSLRKLCIRCTECEKIM